VRQSLVQASLKLFSFFIFIVIFYFFKFFSTTVFIFLFFSTTVLYLRGTQLQLGLSWESMKFGF
jgi:hypothetical protein